MLAAVLVVVETSAIRQLILSSLTTAGYAAVGARDSDEATSLLKHFVPDAAVFDLDDEDFRSRSLLGSVRSQLASHAPSILLTQDRDCSCIEWTGGGGATMCLSKPFQTRVLVDTIAAMLESDSPERPDHEGTLRCGALVLNARRHRAAIKLGGATHELNLRPKEFRLLTLLMDRPQNVHSREELLRAVWRGAETHERTVDQTVRRIRKELERFAMSAMLETVLGFGYRLVPLWDPQHMANTAR